MFIIKYNLVYNVYRHNSKAVSRTVTYRPPLRRTRMDSIERKAYAKINLGLDVIRRRPDG